MPNLLVQSGNQPQKQPKWTPLFIDRSFTGLYTQRSILHDPSDLVTARFYGGRPDALFDGLNIELTNNLTLARRPGTSAFSTVTYPTSPDRAFEFRLSNNTIQILIDTTTAVYWDQQNGSKTLIYTKAAGAGQAYFQAQGNTCYIGDGVDLFQYTHLNPNGVLWNWGIVPPVNQPTVSSIASGIAAVQWQAATMFTTMGLLNDGTNIQLLTSTMGLGNTTQFGTTGNGSPAFSTTPGVTITDNTCHWTCVGQLQLWAANTSFPPNSVIYDPKSNGIYNNFLNTSSHTSGSARPNFNPTFNTHTDDNGLNWQYIGPPALWKPSTVYNSWWEHPQEMVCTPVLPTQALLLAGTQPIFVQTNNNSTVGSVNTPGTSGTSYTPPWATVIGTQTADGQLVWTCLGSKNWVATTAYGAWSAGSSAFSTLIDGNGNFQVCSVTGVSQTTTPLNGWFKGRTYGAGATIAVQSPNGLVKFTTTAGGIAGATEPTWNYTNGTNTTDNTITWTSNGVTTTPVWGQTYGATTQDGSVTWVNVGTAAVSTWVQNTIWYLPAIGFAPPQSSAPYGGANVIGSAFIQFVTQSGLSGGSAPSWSVTIGGTTTDNTIIWTNEAAFNSSNFSLSWTKGYFYGYSYTSRLASDFYNTNIPPGFPAPLGTPPGGLNGGVSTMSPFNSFLANSSSNGSVNTISGIGSADAQVDTITIWRSADGGPSSELFFLTEIPNPKPISGQAQPWTFTDFLPDVPKTINGTAYPGLNDLLIAPQNNENNPPPAGFLPMANHFQRIWGAVGNAVFNSGGPDVLVGDPNSAFNPVDVNQFLAVVTNLVHTPSGLIVFLTSDINIIAGGPSTISFYSTTLVPGVGLLSYNALDLHGGEIYFFSADGQFLILTPQLQLSRVGFPVGDKLVQFNAANVYVTVHEAGLDNCVFVGDGATGWFRLNPHQVPQGEAIWSPFAAITGGCKMLQSIETSSGVHKLLVGGTGTNQNILQRNLSVFTDNGTPYSAFFTMGAIMLAHPGEIAALGFIECDFAGVGSQPTVSYLLDEVSGAFTTLANHVADPPSLYGPTATASSYFPNRYYFAQNTTPPSRCRFMQIKVDFGNTDTVQNYLHNLTIYGRIFVER